MLQPVPPPIPPSAVAAPAPSVSAALTQTHVAVNSDFAGARIVLYGAVFNPTTQPTDVVVVVRGPPTPIRLVRKVRVLGLWLNSRPVTFPQAPGFYMAASTRPLDQVAGFGQLRRLGIGVDQLRLDTPDEATRTTRFGVRGVTVNRLGDDYLQWREAILRLKRAAGLYDTDPDGVRYVDRNLFRAEVRLPTESPIGRYETEVWLFQDGRPVSVRSGALQVEKVGVEKTVYDFAHFKPWLYGLTAVILALMTGLAASIFFRRN